MKNKNISKMPKEIPPKSKQVCETCKHWYKYHGNCASGGGRQRVPNRYDGGYHYETIYAPERFGKIDF